MSKNRGQYSFFDVENQLDKIYQINDFLPKLNTLVDWGAFVLMGWLMRVDLSSQLLVFQCFANGLLCRGNVTVTSPPPSVLSSKRLLPSIASSPPDAPYSRSPHCQSAVFALWPHSHSCGPAPNVSTNHCPPSWEHFSFDCFFVATPPPVQTRRCCSQTKISSSDESIATASFSSSLSPLPPCHASTPSYGNSPTTPRNVRLSPWPRFRRDEPASISSPLRRRWTTLPFPMWSAASTNSRTTSWKFHRRVASCHRVSVGCDDPHCRFRPKSKGYAVFYIFTQHQFR